MTTHSGHHRETLNFTGFSGYYGFMSEHEGYGGFDYVDSVFYMNTSVFAIHPALCDTGYQNVPADTGAIALGWIYQSGGFESADLKESFSLRSMVAASAWSSNQEWTISTYTYSHGALALKGSESFYLSESVQTLKLGRVGKNIAAFGIKMTTYGSGGNTCSYGEPTYGYQLAFGDMKIRWNGKIPLHGVGRQLPLPGEAMHARHHAMPQSIHSGSMHASHHAGPPAQATHAAAWHSELLAMSHDPGGLVEQFALPHVEHWVG